jgi:hypothetical protein
MRPVAQLHSQDAVVTERVLDRRLPFGRVGVTRGVSVRRLRVEWSVSAVSF